MRSEPDQLTTPYSGLSTAAMDFSLDLKTFSPEAKDVDVACVRYREPCSQSLFSSAQEGVFRGESTRDSGACAGLDQQLRDQCVERPLGDFDFQTRAICITIRNVALGASASGRPQLSRDVESH